ncbi:hypothetical protein SAMN05444358_10311 [Ruegeria halocynthiae]|uniref:Uncharacterized protein n=1 Tax=Ruegeria halocynthiae TaxID=985054 RepID=A0A1H2YY25_9RHOB|nr:hypothetical protein [Ruegeria halocynthiae]SDX09668.1 hypothetical protein SAMN05444358_10311 [Ruegeria halocynthiae]
MRFFISLCLATIIAAPAVAQGIGFGLGIRPAFRTKVTPLQDGTYEVVGIGSSAAVTYWCGIGDYAIRTLGIPSKQRIYVSKPYERGVRTVQFSLTPPEGGDTGRSYSVTVDKLGANMSAGTAQGYCRDNYINPDF